MNDDGTMARMPDLEAFAAEHGLLVVTIADLIQYRLQTERLMRKTAERSMRLDLTGTEWRVALFEASTENRQFLALIKGEVATDAPVLCRVHTGSLVADLLSPPPLEGGSILRKASLAIEAGGRGVVLFFPPKGDLLSELAESAPRTSSGGPAHPLREFGLGAQVLADLGVQKLRLLTNSQHKIAGLTGMELVIVERVPLVSMKAQA